MAGMVRFRKVMRVLVGCVLAWCGKQGAVCSGMAELGEVGRGRQGKAWWFKVSFGEVRRVMAG